MIHCETYGGTSEELTICDIINDVKNELVRATNLHGRIKSAHEGIAVIEEEFLELQGEVFKKDRDKAAMRNEAHQLAAMCIRFIYDLKLSSISIE